jgi:hypothetical protein
MHIVDSQVHIWGADTPQRPWPQGRAHEALRVARLAPVKQAARS